MIGWLLKKTARPAVEKPTETARSTSPENCALWRDVARALDAKPRASR